MSTNDIKKKAEAFNKKNKVGSKIKYKDVNGNVQTGTLAHAAVPQETQVSIYLKELEKKISLDKVVSK